MSAASSAASSGASSKPIFRADLPIGKIVVPHRPIGKVGPDEAVSYPTRWPAHVEAVLKKRGANPVRLYMDGIWDLTHYGHFRALEQAKKAFPNVYLLVGCCNDALTHKYKGQTVLTDLERYESMRAVRWVDEVVPDAPWVITDEFLDRHDIDFVCHDALPYVDTSGQAATGDVYAHLRTIGRFHETQRTEGVSTSELLIRIVKRYDEFIRRNLSRGFSAKEMNVPFLKEKTLRLEMALEKQADKARKQMAKLSDVAESAHYQFLRLFSQEGADMLRSTLRGLRDEVVEGFAHLRNAVGAMRSPPPGGLEDGSAGSSSSSGKAGRAGSVGSSVEEEKEEGDEEDGGAAAASDNEQGAAGSGSSAGAGSRSAASSASSAAAARKGRRGGKARGSRGRRGVAAGGSDDESGAGAGAAGCGDEEEEDGGLHHRAASFVLVHSSGAALGLGRHGSDLEAEGEGGRGSFAASSSSSAKAGSRGKHAAAAHGGAHSDGDDDGHDGEGSSVLGKRDKAGASSARGRGRGGRAGRHAADDSSAAAAASDEHADEGSAPSTKRARKT